MKEFADTRIEVVKPFRVEFYGLSKDIKPNIYSLLSAPSSDNSSRLGKRLWVKKHMPGTKLILASRKNKQTYSKENAILIDDMLPTIEEWNAGGGIGILHTSAASTIKKLEELKKLGL